MTPPTVAPLAAPTREVAPADLRRLGERLLAVLPADGRTVHQRRACHEAALPSGLAPAVLNHLARTGQIARLSGEMICRTTPTRTTPTREAA